MPRGLLKHLRFIVPAIIILLFLALLGAITEEWPPFWPTNLKEVQTSLAVFILGAGYYFLPLRKFSNQRHFNEVSENIRSNLVKASGLSDDAAIFTWQAVRGIFYSFVDNDKSLSAKASLAYFNGLFWTSVADTRAIGVVFSLIALVFWYLGSDNAVTAFGLFLFVVLVTLPISRVLTNRHKEIGNEQIEIIEHNYRNALIQKLQSLRDRSNRTSDTQHPEGA